MFWMQTERGGKKQLHTFKPVNTSKQDKQNSQVLLKTFWLNLDFGQNVLKLFVYKTNDL